MSFFIQGRIMPTPEKISPNIPLPPLKKIITSSAVLSGATSLRNTRNCVNFWHFVTSENYTSRFLITCTTVTDTITLMKFADAFSTQLILTIIIIGFRTLHQGASRGALQYKYKADTNHHGVYTTWVKALCCRLSNLSQYSR